MLGVWLNTHRIINVCGVVINTHRIIKWEKRLRPISHENRSSTVDSNETQMRN